MNNYIDRNCKYSIIVPVLHESVSINRLLRHLETFGEREDCEIIVVDGDPSNGTIDVITDTRIISITSVSGRGMQLNAGAASAQGDIFIFLHADSRLPANAFQLIHNVVQKRDYVGGAFDLRIKSKHRFLRIISRLTSIRARMTRIPYGDQAIFIRKEYFYEIGGFKNIKIMEDVELMKRIRKKGDKICILKEYVLTSSRKWEKEGLLWCTIKNRIISLLYIFGVHTDTLERMYYGRSSS